MCYRPVTIKNPATGEYMQVPCGKCLDCLRRYQNDWSIRMYEEYKARGCKGVFFTLTYDNDHVPKNYFVDGKLYRSAPDYGFGNVRMPSSYDSRFREGSDTDACIKGDVSSCYGKPVSPRGVRKKYAEAAHACLCRAGVLRDDEFEPNQEILDFNCPKRQPTKRKAFLHHLQTLFADYFALTTPPPERVMSEPLNYEELEGFLTLEAVCDDVSNSFRVDEETGELLPKLLYKSPIAEMSLFRERPIVSFNSVRKEDVQLWLKRNWTRWKREHGDDRPVTHFITSEYGPSTLRPHYHGCFFGATAEELRPWFEDWQKHYGIIVTFGDLDITKGGLNYVAKYCSKGSFEHPLCAKDFFYFYHRAADLHDVICSEYHSKHYEKCIQWFGVDYPIVDPTFHLVSKGLGSAWCEKDVPRCKEFEELYVHAPDSMPEEALDFDAFIEGRISVPDLVSLHEDYLKQYVENEKKWKEFHERGATMEAWLLSFSERCCYKRNFVSSKGEKVFAFALPKYYRQKMFGVGLSASYPNFVRSLRDKEYQQTLSGMVSSDLYGEDSASVLALEAQDRQELVDRFNRCVEKFKRFYSKSQF